MGSRKKGDAKKVLAAVPTRLVGGFASVGTSLFRTTHRTHGSEQAGFKNPRVCGSRESLASLAGRLHGPRTLENRQNERFATLARGSIKVHDHHESHVMTRAKVDDRRSPHETISIRVDRGHGTHEYRVKVYLRTAVASDRQEWEITVKAMLSREYDRRLDYQ